MRSDQKMLMVDSCVLPSASRILPSPRSRKMEPSAGFLKYFSTCEYMPEYSATFLLASSRSRRAFSRRLVRTASSSELLCWCSAIVLLCCACSFSSLVRRLPERSSSSRECRCCSSLSPFSRTPTFFLSASISSRRMRSWSPEWSACLSSFSVTSSSEVSSSLFWRLRTAIRALASACCSSECLWREERSCCASLRARCVFSSLAVTSSRFFWACLALMPFSLRVRSSSFCWDLSSASRLLMVLLNWVTLWVQASLSRCSLSARELMRRLSSCPSLAARSSWRSSLFLRVSISARKASSLSSSWAFCSFLSRMRFWISWFFSRSSQLSLSISAMSVLISWTWPEMRSLVSFFWMSLYLTSMLTTSLRLSSSRVRILSRRAAFSPSSVRSSCSQRFLRALLSASWFSNSACLQSLAPFSFPISSSSSRIWLVQFFFSVSISICFSAAPFSFVYSSSRSMSWLFRAIRFFSLFRSSSERSPATSFSLVSSLHFPASSSTSLILSSSMNSSFWMCPSQSLLPSSFSFFCSSSSSTRLWFSSESWLATLASRSCALAATALRRSLSYLRSASSRASWSLSCASRLFCLMSPSTFSSSSSVLRSLICRRAISSSSRRFQDSLRRAFFSDTYYQISSRSTRAGERREQDGDSRQYDMAVIKKIQLIATVQFEFVRTGTREGRTDGRRRGGGLGCSTRGGTAGDTQDDA